MESDVTIAESFVKPELFESTLHLIALFFEAAGVLVMVLGLLLALLHTGRHVARGEKFGDAYHLFRTTLARSILLGLELLVAADIIGTVAVKPTIDNLSVLGLIVVIRTFLSFALQIEISGRLPWKSASPNEMKPAK